ncbi:hypothetical protein P4O66_013779 [Electrophorus voltai]|uniref:Transmembrane protein 254 n=1 Tax=Electrophorus voltai TaxID=2609070 RepID=A0AAD8Z5N9_9TELE|nr:hypothetical protein P4O66_013779 [Electrophorus voltai]
MSTSDGYAYFRRSSVSWIMVVMLSMGFYTWVVFWPDQVPYTSLGPLGAISKHLVNEYYGVLYKGWWLAWVVHVFESLVALKLCRTAGVVKASSDLLPPEGMIKASTAHRLVSCGSFRRYCSVLHPWVCSSNTSLMAAANDGEQAGAPLKQNLAGTRLGTQTDLPNETGLRFPAD